MTQPTATTSSVTLGLDIGDRSTHFCALQDRKVVGRGSCKTTQEGLAAALERWPGAQVALEAGSQSPWMSRYLKKRGYSVHVVDPRRVQLISKDPRKTDRRDAELLARLEAGMPELLGNVRHRSEQAQADLALIRARDQLVQTRTSLVLCCRSLSKAFGVTLPKATTVGFTRAARDEVPELLVPAIGVLLDQIDSVSAGIRGIDRQIAAAARERYPEVARLQEVNGVGILTATAFVLTIEDPARFRNSRLVGSWLGLCPRSHASGDSNPELGISKAGDRPLRRLLVQCCNYILGPFSQDSDLKRFGLRLAARGGKAAKRRAVVATARKLAVLLHHLWKDQLTYEPLHHAQRQAA